MQLSKHLRERDGGFTLIELLIVVIIIGILAAIAIPSFLNQRESAWDASAKSDVKNMTTVMETIYTEQGDYAGVTVATLESEGFTATDNLLHGVTPYNGDQSFVVCAQHSNSANVFYWDSEDAKVVDAAPTAGCTPA